MTDGVKSKALAKDVTRCPYCHEDCAADEATDCPDCHAPHHPDCWAAGRGCGACTAHSRAAPAFGQPVRAAAAPSRPPLTLDVVRETLVRAGYSLADIDAVLGARSGAEVDLTLRTPAAPDSVLAVLLRGLLSVAAIALGALAAMFLTTLLTGDGDQYAPVMTAATTAATVLSVLMLLLARRR